jgi:hypothetical protein
MTNREIMTVYWQMYMRAQPFGPGVAHSFLDAYWQATEELIAQPEVMVAGPEIERDNFRRLKAS